MPLLSANLTQIYSTTVETILKESLFNYDIFLVNTHYNYLFEKYVSDLRKYVSKDIIDEYSKTKSSIYSFHNGKLVGLVMKIIILLFNNNNYYNYFLKIKYLLIFI